MTWPASLPLVPVRLTLDQLLSTPGDVPDARVTFILPGPLAGPDSLVMPIPRAVRAGVDGTSTVNLPPNDASGWSPTGWAYTVLIEAGPAMVTGTLELAAADVDAGVDLSARLVLDAVPQPGVTYIPASQKGQPLGVATLGANGLVPTSQLPASSGGTGGAVDSVAGRTGDVVLVAADLSDSSSVGRSVVTAANAAAARTAIGAGTSSLALGTTSTTAYRGDLGAAATTAAADAAAAAAAAQGDVDTLSASLGGAALLDVGTTAGDVAAGNAPAAAVTTHVAAADPHTQYARIYLDTGGTYGVAASAEIYVGDTDPGAVADGSVWLPAS